MNEAERIARAHRAQSALDEFLSPMLDALRTEYAGRIAEIAATELHPTIRADKITSLSIALKVIDNVRSGMVEIVRDGELANQSKARAEKIEQMSDAQQRLLKIGVI